MPTLHVLRVFVGPEGNGGNALGVFLHGPQLADAKRQAVAAEIGFSETVFVDDPADGQVRIYTPAAELGFAGHPLVGTGWLLAREVGGVGTLRPPAGPVATWADDAGRQWIRGRPEWAPPMELVELPSPDDVDAIDAATGGPSDAGQSLVWAWEDAARGLVRARCFAPGIGIVEDEATGAAAVRLCGEIGHELVIRQGVGSQLLARPGPDDSVEVGGAVEPVEAREFTV